jgi:glycine C-acetyltransferase
MQELEEHLKFSEQQIKMIVTDGVFSMDGEIAKLDRICELAEKYDSLVFVDDCHATGFVGKHGRGTPELFGLQDRIDLVNSTLGKALGGASGGYSTGRKNLISLLRQKSRPYLFSNSLAPSVAASALRALEIIDERPQLREKLNENIVQFRNGMAQKGFKLLGNPMHPIAPVMIGDAALTANIADELLQEGIYVIGFSYPVVPKGLARIRVQISAAHSKEQIDLAVEAFAKLGKRYHII